MRVAFTPVGWSEYHWWRDQDRKQYERINALIEAIRRNPFRGIGKPEPLRGEMSGLWSRRIDREHRLVYEISGKDETQTLLIVTCRFHY